MNKEVVNLEGVEAPEEPTTPGLPDAPTRETPEIVESHDGDEGFTPESDAPLHELVGSAVDDADDLDEHPDLYGDSEIPPEDEDWEALPETPLLEEGYEPLTEDDEVRQLDEETFQIEELGPIASPPSIQHYQVQARTHEDAAWETIAYVDPEEDILEVADLPVGETWSFRIRTVFTNGGHSAWSAPSPVVFPEDMLAPGIPSAPIVVGNHAGIGVTWDGLTEDGGPMPADFARVIIWQSPTGEDGTFERRASIPGAMEAILTGYNANEPHYFAFTAMDHSGNESGFSEIASGYRIPLVDVTELKEELDTLKQTDADMSEAQQGLDQAFSDMADRQDDFDSSMSEAVGRIGAAEEILGPLPQQLQEAQAEAQEAREAAEAAETRAVDAMSFVSTVLQNGSFEEGLTNWATSGGAGLADDITRSGVLAGLLPERGDSLTYDETLSAVAGQIWELSGYYYCGTDPQVGITFTYYDENGTALETVSEIELAGRVGVWNSFGPFRIEAPENSATMGFTIESVTGTGYVRVDDIALRDVTDVVRLEQAATAARKRADDAAKGLQASLELYGLGDYVFLQEDQPAPPPAGEVGVWIKPSTDGRFVYDHGASEWVPVTKHGFFESITAHQASIINASMQNLTVTEKANFVNAYAEQLYADEFSSRVADIARLRVGSQNLIPGMTSIKDATPPPFKDRPFGRNTSHPSIWVSSGADDDQGSNTATTSADEDALIWLEAGETYLFRVGASAQVTGSRYYIQLLDASGSSVSVVRDGVTSSYLVANKDAGGASTAPIWQEAEVVVPKTQGYRLRFYVNHSNGTANPDSYQWFHGLEFRNKLDGQVLVDGTLKARHMENTGDILTDALKARKIKGVDIDGDTFTGNTFQGGLFKGAVVQGGTVQTHEAPTRGIKMTGSGLIGYDYTGSTRFYLSATTGNMTSHNGTISGAMITGGTVQTDATLYRGVKMTSDGLKAYSNSGRETVSIDASNGNVFLDGGDITGFDITGSTLRLGPRFLPGASGSQGLNITTDGHVFGYDSSGNIHTQLNGSTNRITGELRTSTETGGAVTLGPGIYRGRPGIRLSTGSSSQLQPVIQSMGAESDGYPAGALVLNGRETRTNETGRTDLILEHGGDFALRQSYGAGSGLGLHKSGRYVHIQGRLEDSMQAQTKVGQSSGARLDSGTASYRWEQAYGSPVPAGTRHVVATPYYSHSSSLAAAKIGINRQTASTHSATVSERTTGVTWRYNWVAIWI